VGYDVTSGTGVVSVDAVVSERSCVISEDDVSCKEVSCCVVSVFRTGVLEQDDNTGRINNIAKRQTAGPVFWSKMIIQEE